jgi:transcriptional regulator with XRE-family HTH domain
MKNLKKKAYREAFVRSQISVGIPFQVRTLREKKGWKQEQLAEACGMLQPRISAIERPGGSKLNLETLLRLAAAFDTGLTVRFAPFSEMLRWANEFSPDTFQVPSFTQEQDAEAELESVESIAPVVPAGTLNTTLLDRVMAAKQPSHSSAEQMRRSLLGQGQPPPNIIRVLTGAQERGGSTYAALSGNPG